MGNAQFTKELFIAIIGIAFLITGLLLEVNLGVLIIYAIFSIIAGLAQYRKASFLNALPIIAIGSALIIHIKIYEIFYLMGCMFIAYGIAKYYAKVTD